MSRQFYQSSTGALLTIFLVLTSIGFPDPAPILAQTTPSCAQDVASKVSFDTPNIRDEKKKLALRQRIQTIYDRVCAGLWQIISDPRVPQRPQPGAVAKIRVGGQDLFRRYDKSTKTAGAFYVPSSGEIIIDEQNFGVSAEVDHIIAHEIIHSFQDFYTEGLSFTNLVMEGATEYFARKYYPDTSAYDNEVTIIKEMIAAGDRLEVLDQSQPNSERFLAWVMIDGAWHQSIQASFGAYLPKGQASAFDKINYALKNPSQKNAQGKRLLDDVIDWLKSIPGQVKIPEPVPPERSPIPREGDERACNRPVDSRINPVDFDITLEVPTSAKPGEIVPIKGSATSRGDQTISAVNICITDPDGKWYYHHRAIDPKAIAYDWKTAETPSKLGEHTVRLVLVGGQVDAANPIDAIILARQETKIILTNNLDASLIQTIKVDPPELDLTIGQPIKMTITIIFSRAIDLASEAVKLWLIFPHTTLQPMVTVAGAKATVEVSVPAIAWPPTVGGEKPSPPKGDFPETDQLHIWQPAIESVLAQDEKKGTAQVTVSHQLTGQPKASQKKDILIKAPGSGDGGRGPDRGTGSNNLKVPDFFGVQEIRLYLDGLARPKSPEEFVAGLIDVLLAFLAVAAFIALVVGGIQYMTSFGDEEKATTAKRTLVYAVTGLIISVSLFTIIKVISTSLRGFFG